MLILAKRYCLDMKKSWMRSQINNIEDCLGFDTVQILHKVTSHLSFASLSLSSYGVYDLFLTHDDYFPIKLTGKTNQSMES